MRIVQLRDRQCDADGVPDLPPVQTIALEVLHRVVEEQLSFFVGVGIGLASQVADEDCPDLFSLGGVELFEADGDVDAGYECFV